MLSIYDKFMVQVLRQCVHHYKWVTGTTVKDNTILFSLEKPGEELRITKNDDSYVFLYTTDTKARSEVLHEDTLTLKNIKLRLGYLFYI